MKFEFIHLFIYQILVRAISQKVSLRDTRLTRSWWVLPKIRSTKTSLNFPNNNGGNSITEGLICLEEENWTVRRGSNARNSSRISTGPLLSKKKKSKNWTKKLTRMKGNQAKPCQNIKIIIMVAPNEKAKMVRGLSDPTASYINNRRWMQS